MSQHIAGEYEAWIAEVFGDTEFCTDCCDKLAEYHARKPNALKSQPEQLPSNSLLSALKDLAHAYVRLIESGRDRIVSLGGDCDPVDVMERGDPYLRKAKDAIEAAERPAPETVSAPAAERVPLRYGKPFTGIHRGISRGGFHCTDNDCSCHLYQYPRAELKAGETP